MATSDNPSTTTTGHGPLLDVHHILHHGPLATQRTRSGSSSASSNNNEAAMREKRDSVNKPKAYSSSSRNTQTSTSTRTDNRNAQRDVRTLPRKAPHSG
jgi:hypothetical protein